MSWYTILHNAPPPPLPPLPAPSWAEAVTPLPLTIHLLPAPDPHQHCALCGKRVVVATNGTQVACVRCMPRLGSAPPMALARAPTLHRRRLLVGLVLVGVLAGMLLGTRWRAVPQAQAPVEVRRVVESPLLPQYRYVRQVTPEEGY